MVADYRGAVEEREEYEEGIVQRCADCDWCFYEHTLPPEQRRVEILQRPIPKKHLSIERIEQLCGKNHPGKCDVKEVVIRQPFDERAFAQNKCLEIYKWDLGAEATFNFTGREWVRPRDMGRGFDERPAGRFDEIWGLGILEYENGLKKQSLTPEEIYGKVMAEEHHYDDHLLSLQDTRMDHNKRIARRRTSPLVQVTN